MNNHSRPTCSLTGHPDYNTSGDWSTSKHGKLYAAAGKNRLRYGEDVKGNPNGQIKAPRTQGGKPDKDKKSYHNKKREYAHDAPLLAVESLLDTGAVLGNYCSKRVVA
ncbi:hypothetical protein B484DRAFT_410442 [Ochromonadaceae sp. CCMP2298]|nr:hypothetical protein B484DRAFT_410442 [Ochromonadaceae sp. CCMP2298]